MSTEAASDSLTAGTDGTAARRACRLALGVTAGFVVAEGFDWSFSFLPPMLAVTLLAQPRCPSVRQGLGVLAVIVLTMGFALLLTAGLITDPAVLVPALALVLFLSFHAQARGGPDMPLFLLQIAIVAVPVLAVLSWSLAQDFAATMLYGMAVALLIAWASHAVLPEREPLAAVATRPPRPDIAAGTAVWQAAGRTFVMLPILAWFVLDATQVALVCLIVTLSVVRRFEPGGGSKVALGLILGNLVGGLLAAVVYNIIQLHPTIGFFAVACLIVSLVLAAVIVRGGPMAPVVTIALSTFILVLGQGLAPLPGGSEESFASRITNVLAASAYAVGGMALLGRARP